MKLSTKLNKRISDFATSIESFSEKIGETGVTVDNLNDLVVEGDEQNQISDKEINKALKKFQRIKNYAANFSEEVDQLSDDAEKISEDISKELDNADPAKESFARKFRVLAKRFAGISNDLDNITSEATSVINMTPENAVTATTDVTTKAETIDNAPGAESNGGEVTVTKPEVQTKPESIVNFSFRNYVKFAAKSIRESFAEVVDEAKEAKDTVKNVAKEVTTEPEIKPAEGGKPEATPQSTEAPKTEVAPPKPEDTPPADPKNDKPDKKDEPPAQPKNFGEENNDGEPSEETEDDIEAEIEEIQNFAEKAILEDNEDASDEITEKLENLEQKAPGKGEEVMAKLENFSAIVKKVKNHGTVDGSIFNRIKDFAVAACDAATNKTIDPDDLGSKAEDLERNQPGAGELLTSVIECFGKIIDACKAPPAAPDAPQPLDTSAFCGKIDKFVNDIQIEDKRFARELKSKCFALANAIEDKDTEQIKKFCGDVATSLDNFEDNEVVKEFGESLVKFCEEYNKSFSNKPEAPAEGAAIPENIAKADSELNKVLDKLDEQGAKLKPEVATFAKRLFTTLKSMKCFTEKDLDSKLSQIEGLKKDFDSAIAAPAVPEKPAEVKPTENKAGFNVQPKLVIEDEKNPAELPSDASITNFSEVPGFEDDPLGHLASLEVR